jgi:hypothetical protein
MVPTSLQYGPFRRGNSSSSNAYCYQKFSPEAFPGGLRLLSLSCQCSRSGAASRGTSVPVVVWAECNRDIQVFHHSAKTLLPWIRRMNSPPLSAYSKDPHRVLAIDATPQIRPSHPVWAYGRREKEGGDLPRKARRAAARGGVGAALHRRPWPRVVQTNHGRFMD